MALPQYQPQQEQKQIDPIQAEKQQLYEFVKDIPLRIGVHAGKGGVGKTLIATQLALQLTAQGKQVGLIDADVDCPNVPDALGLNEELKVGVTGRLQPVTFKEVQIVSSGFMQEPGQPLIIRGPIKHRLLTDFIEKTEWKDLDVLIFDFPPGTSDIPLSAMQVANLTGVIIVTTNTGPAIHDAKRAVNMARKLGVHIYGIVENMAGDVFGTGAGEKLAEEMKTPFIARIPLDAAIRKKAEQGAVSTPDLTGPFKDKQQA